MSYTITLEVDVDTESLDELTELNFTGVEEGKVRGNVSADVEKIIENSVDDVRLSESDLPTPIAIAVSQSI